MFNKLFYSILFSILRIVSEYFMISCVHSGRIFVLVTVIEFMKTRAIVMMLGLLLTFSSCVVHTVHTTTTPAGSKLPPGQAKKVYGTKSAKPFAPGQQKK